ncbi:hypothetical protein CDL15_Pgr023878 [Punica granatum]|nr:hypothetical protein CDL15_Pgr023878 [Punica granatum]
MLGEGEGTSLARNMRLLHRGTPLRTPRNEEDEEEYRYDLWDSFKHILCVRQPSAPRAADGERLWRLSHCIDHN